MVPFVQWSPNLDVSAAFARLRDNFVACRDTELYVKYGKAMAHLCIQSVKINSELLVSKYPWHDEFRETRSRFIRDAFMTGRVAYNQLKNTKQDDAQRKHKADVRTALRTMVVHSRSDHLSRPDDENLIWHGDLHWRDSDGHVPGCEEFDWLVDYLTGETERDIDDDTKGDALFALSAMRGLGSSAKRPSYIRSLIRCMGPTRPSRVRHAALRAVSEARRELASITSASMPQGVDAQLLNELSRALFTVVHPSDDQTIHDTGPDTSFHNVRDSFYIRLIFALAKNDEWYQRLTRHDHLDRCISLVDRVCQMQMWATGFYLIVIVGRIKSSGKDLPFSPAQEKWRLLVINSWDIVPYTWMEEHLDEIPALVTSTRLNLTASDDGIPSQWFIDVAAKVHHALFRFQEKRSTYLDNGVAQAAVDAAISSAQGLDAELSRVVEDRKIS
ncbi:hypothetical protein EDB19DRAFT_1909538 [Suillus lakei]|nr:hypothetical protein EDB19DRAFT_1909538 [Suillus lakei]